MQRAATLVHTSDTPYIADWFVVSLRWLVLLGLTISLAMGNRLLEWPNLLLLGLGCWNIVLMLMAGLNRRLVYHREISLGIDWIVVAVYFWLQGGFAAPAFWVVLLPLLSSALYFEMRGALLSAGIMIAVEIGITFLLSSDKSIRLFSGLAGLATLILGALFGILGRSAIRNIRKIRDEQIAAQQKRLRVENERLRAVYELTSTLMTTLNYQRVLDTALDLSLSAINTDQDTQTNNRLVSAVLLFSGNEKLEVGSARRFTPTDMRVTLPGREGAMADAMETGEPVLVGQVGSDPELNHIVALRTCGQVYVFPLRSGFSIYGVLIFGHPDANYFSQDRKAILEILGRQAVIAIANARLYQELADEHNRLIDVQEEARKKLARDLHDGPTQSVSAIAMRVNLARRMIDKTPQKASDELEKVEELARRTSKEIRHMLFTLRPLILESQGLVAALKAMAEKMKETYTQEVSIEVDAALVEQLEVGKQGVIFFIVEEAVNNARKHAQAARIWVQLRSIDKELALLEIKDNGIGFDVDAVNRTYDKRGSLGLINLRERTELINGILNIQSAPGKGTRVQVAVPITEEAADRLRHSAGRR